MARKIIGVASSDWHFNDWNQFNKNDERLWTAANFFSELLVIAEEHDVPILFSGDLGHTPKGLSTKTFQFLSGIFRTAEDNFNVEIWGIDGNHDQSETNLLDKLSPSIWKAFCNCFPKLLKDIGLSSKVLKKQSVQIFGVPYLTHNTGLSEYIKKISKIADENSDRGWRNILLLHSDIWGARDPSGREVGSVENIPRNLGKFFKSFDLVLCGHIHKHEELWKNQIYMVGAPFQQRKSDMGCDMGYMVIYNDMSVKFIPYKAPVIKEYEEGEGHPDDGNYWVKIPKIKKREIKEGKRFTPTMDRSKMAKRYVEQKGITNRSKVNALIEILNRIDDHI